MQQVTIDTVKQEGLLLLETIAGSRAYGLATAQSDTDIRGIFVLPRDMFYSIGYVPQVSNETNDIVYYELGRFVELLIKNNPTILELLNMPADCILYKDERLSRFSVEVVLSKLCEATFANYAYAQINKAVGLEKKIMNPMGEQRKSVLDFCYVYRGKQAISLTVFLAKKGWLQENIGLAAVPHFRDCYNLFYADNGVYKGIVRKEQANEVCVESIPIDAVPEALLYFNKDAYSVYCKQYKAYWDWVAKRNNVRYESTMTHGKKYDAKNMMHVFRLLLMAKEIATEQVVNVFRKDRDFLLSIKAGKFEYDELVQQAEQISAELPLLYSQSTLPDEPDVKKLNELLIVLRNEFYG